ncbi:hypothetical protein A2886_00715 [candidate division WWE3 bacterium RIFCSPHIGHO2_01_FULL_42_13]|uniref:Uncharacterized protein n=1 Tax=candidate division WWE3 bacterium RIFCSPHIGHO2_01_FULL_42_13 TaxID=1802617 RepID=A0A1F4USK2_UNCKA|nr:MAG: hypothetical protein A2886_00715 [candidate division WWE3 bacterium RIFCSPHIGHO2_01_FULL_42_13]
MKLKLPKIKTNKANLLKLSTKLSFFLLILSLTAQVVITNKYAVKGNEMAALLNRQETLEREVSSLKLEISRISSLALIEEHAYALGFQEYNQPMAVISSAQFAAATTPGTGF